MVLRLTQRSLSIALCAFSTCALSIAACANSAAPPAGGAGSGASNSGSSVGGNSGTGSSGSGGLGGTNSGSVLGGSQDATSSSESCQQFDVQFTLRIPLVYVLADSSGSMFTPNTFPDGGQADDWQALGQATLSVIQSLNSEVDFGFGDYGSNGSVSAYTPAGYAANMCGILNNVPIAANNYAAINSVYQPLLTANMQPYNKTNTPAALALGQAAEKLAQGAVAISDGGVAAGGTYILFVTDGQTDFCDDVEQICATDGVIEEIQALYGQGIKTLVLGLPSTESTGLLQSLQAFANAGSGLPVIAPPLNPGEAPASALTIMQQCNGAGGWSAIQKTLPAGAGPALGTYASPDAAVANAPLYSPAVADVASLTNEISAALKTVKSCSFDLQGHISVDLAQAGAGSVVVDGTALPYTADGGANGWTMASATELDLVGSACDNWRATGKNISFNFPCDIIIGIPR